MIPPESKEVGHQWPTGHGWASVTDSDDIRIGRDPGILPRKS